MSVLITNEFAGANEQVYQSMIAELAEPLRAFPGFVSHVAGPIDGGWQVTEVWESREQHDAWIAKHVAPIMPEGLTPPTTTVREIHTTIAP